jgi:excisionase family DNA binding protein
MIVESKNLEVATRAALLLGVSRERVVRMVQTGELGGGQIGGRWMVERRALRALLAEKAAAAK